MEDALSPKSRLVFGGDLGQKKLDKLQGTNNQRWRVFRGQYRGGKAGYRNELEKKISEALTKNQGTGQTVKTCLSSSASKKLTAFKSPVKLFTRTGVTTLAAYTSTRIGTRSCMNLPTTSGLDRRRSIRLMGASFAGTLEGPSASGSDWASACDSGAGLSSVETAATLAAAVVGGMGRGKLAELAAARRAAARSALALALVMRLSDFSVYAL